MHQYSIPTHKGSADRAYGRDFNTATVLEHLQFWKCRVYISLIQCLLTSAGAIEIYKTFNPTIMELYILNNSTFKIILERLCVEDLKQVSINLIEIILSLFSDYKAIKL